MTTNIQPRLIGNDWLEVEMEMNACISTHLQKPTDAYIALHFPGETNTRGSAPFHTN